MFILCYFTLLFEPGSSVGMAIGYGLDDPGIESLWGARFSAPVQTGPGAHSASCIMSTGSLPSSRKRPGRDADPSSPSIAVAYKGSIVILLLSLRAFVACKKGETYLFNFIVPWKPASVCIGQFVSSSPPIHPEQTGRSQALSDQQLPETCPCLCGHPKLLMQAVASHLVRCEDPIVCKVTYGHALTHTHTNMHVHATKVLVFLPDPNTLSSDRFRACGVEINTNWAFGVTCERGSLQRDRI
jgi:hypothetical protein